MLTVVSVARSAANMADISDLVLAATRRSGAPAHAQRLFSPNSPEPMAASVSRVRS